MSSTPSSPERRARIEAGKPGATTDTPNAFINPARIEAALRKFPENPSIPTWRLAEELDYELRCNASP